MKEFVPGRGAVAAPPHAARESQLEQELEQELAEEFSMGFSPEELREFLAADLIEDPADPDFRERLRSELWAIVQERYGPPASSPPPRRRPKN